MNEGPGKRAVSFREKFEQLGSSVEEAADNPELHAQPNFVGLESLRPQAHANFERAMKICREYALAPIIRDDFGNDHERRRGWRDTLSPDLRSYYMRNKLRANSIMKVSGVFSVIVSELDAQDIHSPKAETIRSLNKDIPNEIYQYQSLSEAGKEEIVIKVDSVCRQFLVLMTKE